MTGNDIWTIKAAMDWTEGYLARKGDENPRLSTQWLLAEATGMRRIELYAHFDRPLSLEERDVLRDYVARRGKGEPLQYITGEVGFRHIAVAVRPGVLIPRPETEVLVSEALALLPQKRAVALEGFAVSEEQLEAARKSGLLDSAAPVEGSAENADAEVEGGKDADAESADATRQVGEEPQAERESLLVADICTGSGCIACSIAYEHPETTVIATDISPEAVSLACENVQTLGLGSQVQVVQSDIADNVDEAYLGRFDLVVSNPPYIPSAVMRTLSEEVSRFEPALALDGGDDGLDVFRKLLAWCDLALRPGGAFAFELHETCLEAAAGIARASGFSQVRVVNDLAQRPRVLTGRKALQA